MNAVAPYPLLFQPIYQEKIWGGRALERLGRTLPPEVRIGESWELADLPESVPGGRSVVANGPWSGQTLRQVIEQHHDAIMGAAALGPDGGFPLLIKYLDARENLSVQVHPDEAYAERHAEAHLKSEAWVVIEAEPGAVIYKGVRPEVTREQFAAAIERGEVEACLVRVPVQVGDCHYLPSGTCHALGAGVLVAEVQTPSDTTFRVFDWDRPGRTLHVEQALACIRFGEAPSSRPAIGPSISSAGLTVRSLVRSPYFSIDRVDVDQATTVDVVTAEAPLVWMILKGRMAVEMQAGDRVDIGRGATVLLPAGLSDAVVAFEPDTAFLRVHLPSPLEGLIA
jgi:mannose-6-phosphate isomerase